MKPKLILDPIIADFIATLEKEGGKPISELTIEQARQLLESVQHDPLIQELPASVEVINAVMADGSTISLSIIRPQLATDTLPVIMYFHGAGWILGSFTTHERLMKQIALGTHAAVVYVDYTRSPEAAYPVALEQAYAATQYIVERADELHLDASRLVVAGDSIGGNMAIAVTLLAKEREDLQIGFQLLLYPVTDARLKTESYSTFEDGPWLTKASMRWFWNAYEPNYTHTKDILIAPILATSEQLQGLPPALIITAENDVLRDEGEEYARHLIQAGVPVQSYRALGAMHDFLLLTPIQHATIITGTIELINMVLRARLQS